MQRAGRPRLWGLRVGHSERTENMYAMSVTLDVSRLSGWLNADAPYRAKGEAQEGLRADWEAGRRAAGGGGACSVLKGPDCGG